MNLIQPRRVAFVHGSAHTASVAKNAYLSVRPLTKRFSQYQGNWGHAKVATRRQRCPARMCLPDTETKPSETLESSSQEAEAPTSAFESVKTSRYALGALYACFMVYAFFLAPGSVLEPGEIGKILSGKTEDVNDLFFAIFTLLGVIGVNFGALLNAGACRQKKLSTTLFSALGVFLGFPAIGPYLVGRDYVPKVSREEVNDFGVISKVLESPWFSVGTLILALWCYAFALGLFTPGSEQLHDVIFYATRQDLARLATVDRGVCVSMVDLVALSTLVWGPLTEDMTRRGWFKKGEWLESAFTALSILLAPGLGTSLYLVLRPRLPSREQRTTPSSEA